jgi:enoyl-CoA hydratase
MAATDPVLTVEKDGAVRIVRLNRPESLNAVNPALHTALVKVWGEIQEDRETRAVVLTGAGKAFCAGGDIDSFRQNHVDEEKNRRSMEEARQLVANMAAFPLPVVAAVNGPAVGLGASLAMMADVVFIADTAFLADPHVVVGLVAADGGSVTWPLMMSLLKAKEYLLTGDRIPAEEAKALGLANRVVPGDCVLSEALAFAHRLAGLPAVAVQGTKRALNKHLEAAIHSVLDFALAAEAQCFSTDDHRQAVDAFLARSKR